MVDSRHIVNRLLAISQQLQIVRLTWKLVRRSRNRFWHKSRDQNTKFRKFKMADSRHFEKWYLSRESSNFNEIWCTDADSGSKNSHVTKDQHFANSKWWTAAILKIVFGYISTIYWPINAKFGFKKQNLALTQVTWPKHQISQIQNGVIATSQPRIIQIRWNLIRRCQFWLYE